MAGIEQHNNSTTLTPFPTSMITTDPSPTTSFAAVHRRTRHLIIPSPPPSVAAISGERGAGNPQWGRQETVELIHVRGELEREFTVSKRNKALWETVAGTMREKGFVRTPDQCKCKWKNLVNRYKVKETSGPETGKQFPFFEELHAVFSERAKDFQMTGNSQQVVVQSRKRLNSNSADRFSDDFSQEGDDEVDDRNEESLMQHSYSQKRVLDRETIRVTEGDKVTSRTVPNLVNFSSSSGIMEMLKAFFQQQQSIDMQWRDSMKRHQHERKLFESQWRQSMETLERERLMLEQEWREREEQRKIQEEVRAEKRDALLTTLLNQLISDDHL